METGTIIAGNICSLGAMVTDSISGTRKKQREILGIQIISQVFYGVSTIILQAYSGTAQNAVAIFRNLAAMKGIKNKAVEWTLIALGVVLGIVFNNRGLIGWLPIVANLEYSVAVFQLRDRERELRIAFLINMLVFMVFGIIIMNYVSAVSCAVVAVTTAVALVRDNGKKSGDQGRDGDRRGDDVDSRPEEP